MIKRQAEQLADRFDRQDILDMGLGIEVRLRRLFSLHPADCSALRSTTSSAMATFAVVGCAIYRAHLNA